MQQPREYWYIEKKQDGVEIFEGRDELQRRIDNSNAKREKGLPESQFYGYFDSENIAILIRRTHYD